MQLKTLLNRVHLVKGSVYKKQQIIEDASEPTGSRIDVSVRPRCNGRRVCSCCGQRGPT